LNPVYAETPAKTIVMPYKLTGNVDTKVDDEHKQRLAMAHSVKRSLQP